MSGPGTKLTELLSTLGFSHNPTCNCQDKSDLMDANEAAQPGWCKENINVIIQWMREESERRRMPFIDAIARLLVMRAIRNARKAAIRQGQG
jgi:hypothetical protein